MRLALPIERQKSTNHIEDEKQILRLSQWDLMFSLGQITHSPAWAQELGQWAHIVD
jgi:hypothetical protein